MSLKSLPLRAPASKVLPRKRSVGERIVAMLELAALVRTLSRVLGPRKRSRRLPSRRGLLAVAGGGLLAAVIGVLLAKRKSGDASPPAPTEATQAPTPAPTASTPPESPAAPPVVPDPENAVETDAHINGGTTETPAVEEKS